MSKSFFKKATKQLAKLKIALTGPAGAGKTMSSLILAKGIGGRCAVIDTENNSACLYSDRFGDWSYDVVPLSPPYTAQKYIEAIEAAIAEKYDVLIIDSYSHVWAGEGGLLAQKDAKDSRGGNSYTNWNSITKLHEQLKSKVLFSDIHVIATMRSKQEYIIEANEKGKQAPKKVGLAPVQREGMEYEFTVVFDIAQDHQFVATKDRTHLFDGVSETITEKTAYQLREWLNSADQTHWVPPAPEPPKPPPPPQPRQAAPQPPPQQQRQVKNHATGQMVNFDDKGNEVFLPGDYVVRINSKSMGNKKLKDCSVEEITKTLEWIRTSAKKPLADSLSEFMQYATQYLTYEKSHRRQQAAPLPPPTDFDEPIPDFDMNQMPPEEAALDNELNDALMRDNGGPPPELQP